MNGKWSIVLLLLIVLALAACGTVETDISVYDNERYEVNMVMTMPTESLAMVGGAQVLEQQLDDIVSQVKSDGLSVRWHKGNATKSNEVAYVIEANGVGAENAGGFGFSLEPVTVNDRDAYRFQMSPGNTTGASEVTFRLHGGDILETNGVRTAGDTVTWENPYGTMNAVLTPRRSGSLWPLLLGILLAASVVAGVFVYRTNRRPSVQPAGSNRAPGGSAGIVYCAHCGAPNEVGSRFCMQCGQSMATRD